MKKTHTPTSSSMGNQFTSSTKYHGESSSGLAAMRMFFSRSVFTISGSLGEKVRNRSPLWYLPCTCWPWIVTSWTSPRSTADQKSLKMISGSRVCCRVKTLKSSRNINPSTSHRARFLVAWFKGGVSSRHCPLEKLPHGYGYFNKNGGGPSQPRGCRIVPRRGADAGGFETRPYTLHPRPSGRRLLGDFDPPDHLGVGLDLGEIASGATGDPHDLLPCQE